MTEVSAEEQEIVAADWLQYLATSCRDEVSFTGQVCKNKLELFCNLTFTVLDLRLLKNIKKKTNRRKNKQVMLYVTIHLLLHIPL